MSSLSGNSSVRCQSSDDLADDGRNVISRVVVDAIGETMQADGNALLDGTNREPQFEVCASDRHD